MALLVYVLLGVSLAEAGNSCHLLQTASEMRRKKGGNRGNLTAVNLNSLQPLADPESRKKGICLSSLTPEEIYRPVEEVVASYREDGWCLYGSMGTWASECAVARKTRDVRPFVEQYESPYKKVENAPNAVPVTLQFPDKRTLTIRDHTYPLDDVYCFVNDWYSFPDRDALLNFSYLEEVSDRACNKLKQELPEYHSLTGKDLWDESMLDGTILQFEEGGLRHVPEVTVRGMQIHAAVKCLMRGSGRGAVCDIANCAARGCLKGSVVHYTQRGECEHLATLK